MDREGFIFYTSAFVTVLAIMVSAGMPLIETPQATQNLDTNTCDNIGGFDVVGDILGCIDQKLGIFNYFDVRAQNNTLNKIFIPIALTTLAIIIFVIRGN